MKYEPVQKGNPHDLVVKQHIFPKRSIQRFCEGTGCVDLFILSGNKRLSIKPDNSIFCVRRSWDERAEKGYGKSIEDKFQSAIEKVLNDNSSCIDHKALTEFYCLWQIRHYWSRLSIPDEDLGVQPEYPLEIDDREGLEKAHIVYVNNEGKIPARILRGLRMQQNLDDAIEKMAGIKWGMLTASQGEFLVPDNFSGVYIVLVNPKLCFAAGYDSQTIRLSSVNHINSLAVSSADRYIFARDFSKCSTLSNELSDLLQATG
jgi:hypothetical protein